MRKVTIRKNPNGDTRTAVGDVSFEVFQEANAFHMQEVEALMRGISNQIDLAGNNHDVTKLINERQFYKQFNEARAGQYEFANNSWYQTHIRAERHHLNAHCPDDVTLIDVLEMIADNVAAGLARSGEVRPVTIPNDILQMAVENTTKLLEESCELCDWPKKPYQTNYSPYRSRRGSDEF